jgi:hypothetical protein
MTLDEKDVLRLRLAHAQLENLKLQVSIKTTEVLHLEAALGLAEGDAVALDGTVKRAPPTP